MLNVHEFYDGSTDLGLALADLEALVLLKEEHHVAAALDLCGIERQSVDGATFRVAEDASQELGDNPGWGRSRCEFDRPARCGHWGLG